MPLDLEREPHVLDLGLRLGEVGDVAKRCWFRFCCSGHGAWIRWSGQEGKGGYSFVPRTQRLGACGCARPGHEIKPSPPLADGPRQPSPPRGSPLPPASPPSPRRGGSPRTPLTRAPPALPSP